MRVNLSMLLSFIILRLELMTALIRCRLLYLKVSDNLYIWLKKNQQYYDSTRNVFWLGWTHITNCQPLYAIEFVKLRLPNLHFRYVPSTQNMTDLPSNTWTIQKRTWWNKCEENWPTKDSFFYKPGRNENKKLANVTVITASPMKYSSFHIEIKNLNSYARLIRITAYYVRFIYLIAKRCDKFSDYWGLSFDYARFFWIKATQQPSYHEVFENFNQTRWSHCLLWRNTVIYGSRWNSTLCWPISECTIRYWCLSCLTTKAVHWSFHKYLGSTRLHVSLFSRLFAVRDIDVA